MNVYKSLFFSLAGIFLVAAAFTFGWWWGQDHPLPAVVPPESPSTSPVVTPEPTSFPSSTPQTTPTQPSAQQQDQEKITQAMATRHGKSPAEVELTVTTNTGAHAMGGVKFTGEMGGGWWLAAKENGTWIIVADGNGTVPCEAIEPYNFPVTMVPECFREATGELVKRI